MRVLTNTHIDPNEYGLYTVSLYLHHPHHVKRARIRHAEEVKVASCWLSRVVMYYSRISLIRLSELRWPSSLYRLARMSLINYCTKNSPWKCDHLIPYTGQFWLLQTRLFVIIMTLWVWFVTWKINWWVVTLETEQSLERQDRYLAAATFWNAATSLLHPNCLSQGWPN